jgi:hypothetical protein
MDSEDLRAVLARAAEIESGRRLALQAGDEVEDVVRAAEEVGLPRDAVMQALRERLAHLQPPEVGELVYAQSADGRFYPARLVSAEPGLLRVRYLKGSDAALAPGQVRRFDVSPGAKVEVPWPKWGWWGAEVVAYNAEAQSVEVTDGMTKMTFPIIETRLRKPATPGQARLQQFLVAAALLVGGTVFGMALMRALTR